MKGPRSEGRGLRGHGLRWYAALMSVVLVAPVAMMIAFGFNQPAGRFNLRWRAFTFDNYRELFAIADLAGALRTSLLLALAAAVTAVAIGAPLGIALARGFRGRGAVEGLVFLPVATPEVVMGAALLGWFITLGVPRGPVTLYLSHVAFSIPFVVAIVRARAERLPEHVEDAARDLGAGPLTVLRTVTLPLLMPALVASAVLTAILSMDDFVISAFTAGGTPTFPLWVYGASRFGVPPQVNVMATLVFVAGALAAAAAVAVEHRRARA